LLTIIAVLVVFSVLILIHEMGHLFVAKKAGIKVEAFSLGMGKRLCGIKIGDTDYRLCLFPFGGYCKMAGEDPSEAKGSQDEFGAKPVGYRFWVVVAGSLTNYIFAFILFSAIFMMGVPTLTSKVGQVLNGYPAEKAGIKSGDKIVSINGKPVVYWDDVLAAIKEFSVSGNELDVKVKRNDQDVALKIKPELSKVTNIFGQTITRPMLGVAPQNEFLPVSYDPFTAVKNAWGQLVTITAMTYKMIWLLLTGGMPLKGTLSGPIGIAYFIKDAAHMGIVPLMLITAHISLALAIFNLLPFPVLDGGHVVFLLIEKLRGKPVSVKAQEMVSQVAVILLITFAVFVSWQDVLRFTPVGKLKMFKQDNSASIQSGTSEKVETKK